MAHEEHQTRRSERQIVLVEAEAVADLVQQCSELRNYCRART